MRPCSRPNRSFRTLASGARQLVVHDAFEITVCFAASNTESFTPMQIVASASPLGAEMTTRPTLPPRCFAALSRPVKMPVDSITTSMSWSDHGISSGSITPRRGTSRPSMVKPSSLAATARSSVPPTESCFSRNAMVSLSPIGSFTATSSTPASAPRARSARVNERPMRPKPLIPTRTVMDNPPLSTATTAEPGAPTPTVRDRAWNHDRSRRSPRPAPHPIPGSVRRRPPAPRPADR